jgi:uncharacterized protein YndB with AHSA1/START domain
VATVTRSRVIPALPNAVWLALADAYTLPRWWPRVTRVEGITETGFTQVLFSKRGRVVRLDHSYTEVEENTALGWRLDLASSSLDRLLAEWHTRFLLEPETDGTRVTIVERQTFRGSFRTGSWMQRRASKQRLDDALDGLAEMFE